jgi:hypothetical protein
MFTEPSDGDPISAIIGGLIDVGEFLGGLFGLGGGQPSSIAPSLATPSSPIMQTPTFSVTGWGTADTVSPSWSPVGGIIPEVIPGLLFFAEGTAKADRLNGRKLANCAADFANRYSLAAGLQAITGGRVSKDNFVVSSLLGNDISAISDILTGRNPVAAGIGEFFSNPSPWNVASLGVRIVGSLPSGGAPTASLGENTAGQVFAKIAGTTAFKGISKAVAAFTVGKLAWDLGIFAVGTAACQQQ